MINIRKAQEQDGNAIACIGIRVWEDFVSRLDIDVDHLREHVHGVYHDGSGCEWATSMVALVNEQVVGWIAREERNFRVSYLNVDPDHEKQGIATELLAGLEKVIREDGFDHVEVELHSSSVEAVSFFRENGYRVVSREMKYSATLLDSAEKLIMRKNFSCPQTASLIGSWETG